MKRGREASLPAITRGAVNSPAKATSQAASRSNAEYRAFLNLKTAYRRRFAEYLCSVWVGTRGVRSAVFVVANKRAVLTLSSRIDGVYQTNLNNPDPKFLHLAIPNEVTDAVQFSSVRGVPYEFPPTNQSVSRAVAALADFVPLEYLPPQIQPRPATAASGESLVKKTRNIVVKNALRF